MFARIRSKDLRWRKFTGLSCVVLNSQPFPSVDTGALGTRKRHRDFAGPDEAGRAAAKQLPRPGHESLVKATITNDPAGKQRGIDEVFLTPAEVGERLKIDDRTVRRLFLNEPGVIIICFPRKGKRVYRTLRIPESVFNRVVTRLAKVA